MNGDEGWGMRDEGRKREPSGGLTLREWHPESFRF